MAMTKTQKVVTGTVAAAAVGVALYVALAGTRVTWCASGADPITGAPAPRCPSPGSIQTEIDTNAPYTGNETSFYARYCPAGGCHDLNGGYIWQGLINTETGTATTAWAYDVLKRHYGKNPTQQEVFDFTIAQCKGAHCTDPWPDEVPATSPTPKPTATPPLCNDHGVMVPCPTPTPKPTPTPVPTPTPSPTPAPTPTPSPKPCVHAKTLTVDPLCRQVVNRAAGSNQKTLNWGPGPQANMRRCQTMFNEIDKGAWVKVDNASTGTVTVCLDRP